MRYVLPSRKGAELFNVVFSPDGRMVAAEAQEGGVDVWETSTGRRPPSLPRTPLLSDDAGLLPDSGRLATGNRDATILIWDVFGKFADNGAGAGPLTGAELDALWVRLGDADAERAVWRWDG